MSDNEEGFDEDFEQRGVEDEQEPLDEEEAEDKKKVEGEDDDDNEEEDENGERKPKRIVINIKHTDDHAASSVPQPRSRENYTTTIFLTKYERARVLGTRALQISMGAPSTVPLDGETDCLRIAQKELQQRKLPIIVRRFLPDNTYEDWKLEELICE